MDGRRIGRAIRAIRHERGWTQAELGARAACSHAVISRLERGNVRACSIALLERVLEVLDARLVTFIDWRGGELDRLIDADHSRLQQLWAAVRSELWQSRVEVTYSEYGERGSIDDLAYHAPTGTLLVTELKTAIYDAGRTLMKLDEKARLAPRVAARFEWRARRVVRCLVVADTRTNRRRAAELSAMLAQFECRGRAAAKWLRDPMSGAPDALLVFVPLTNVRVMHGRRAGRRRVRHTTTMSRSRTAG
jgi:transcriptional regulator with XRE-family HTH domain